MVVNEDDLQQIKGAAISMENLFVTGVYQDNKVLGAEIDRIKEIIKSRINKDEKRKEYSRIGVVAKFQAYNLYTTDYLSLNEYLHSLGLLVPSAKFNYKELKEKDMDILKEIQVFQKPYEQYVKIHPNKKGKVCIPDLNLIHLSDEELIRSWKQAKERLERTQVIINKAREKMLKCPLLQRERKLSCSYGSISLLDKDPSFDVARVFEALGADFLIQHSKPDMQKIFLEFIPKAMLTLNEINQFRSVKSREVKFFLMDLEIEANQQNMLWDMKMQAAENYRFMKEMEVEIVKQELL